MRFKIQSEAPLPPIRSWYSYNPGPNSTLKDVAKLISQEFEIEQKIIFLLQGFPLPLNGFVLDYVKDDDLLMY